MADIPDSEIEAVVAALNAVEDFVYAHRPRGKALETITFREFNDTVDAKESEFGLTQERIAAARAVSQDVRDAVNSLGHTLDVSGFLCEDDLFYDLPIAFREMPEYAPMLRAYEHWWSNRPPDLPGSVIDTSELEAIVRHLTPARPQP